MGIKQPRLSVSLLGDSFDDALRQPIALVAIRQLHDDPNPQTPGKGVGFAVSQACELRLVDNGFSCKCSEKLTTTDNRQGRRGKANMSRILVFSAPWQRPIAIRGGSA